MNKLLLAVEQDMIIHGLIADRIAIFKARINASTLLLQRIYDKKEDAATWSARRIFVPPQRNWSPEQQKVLEAIALTAPDCPHRPTSLWHYGDTACELQGHSPRRRAVHTAWATSLLRPDHFR